MKKRKSNNKAEAKLNPIPPRGAFSPPPPLPPKEKQNREYISSSCERMRTATTDIRVDSRMIRYRARRDRRQREDQSGREAGSTSWTCTQFSLSFGYGHNCLLILYFLCLLNQKKLDQMLKPAEELHVSYCKVINFRTVPVFVLLTWNWFVRTIFHTFEGLKTKLHWNSTASRQKQIFIRY